MSRAGKTTVVRRINSQAGWRVIGGQRIYCRSKMEANYGRVLEFQRKSGLIAAWFHEKTTYWFEGIRRGCVSYLPDYDIVENDGGFRHDEVKGYMDKKSATKLKRMKKYYPDVIVRLIGKGEMAGYKRTMSKLIKDWE